MKRSPLRRHGRLKRKSRRRTARDAEVAEVRAEYRVDHPWCEVCRKVWSVDLHEICRGSRRAASLDKPELLLAVCRKCHDEIQNWKHAKQLAVKKLSGCYSLEVYREVMRGSCGRVAVILTEEDVDAELIHFIQGEVA